MNKRHLLFAFLTSFFLISSRMAYSQAEVMEIRMLTYNIRHGAGMDDVVDLNRQAAVIQGTQPDVVGLQEVDSCVKRSGYIPEAKILGDALGMYSTFGAAIPLTGGKYGVAILSKERPLSIICLCLEWKREPCWSVNSRIMCSPQLISTSTIPVVSHRFPSFWKRQPVGRSHSSYVAIGTTNLRRRSSSR